MQRRVLLSLAVAVSAAFSGCGGGVTPTTPAPTRVHVAASPQEATLFGIKPHRPGFATQAPPRRFSLRPSTTPTLEMYDSIIVATVPSNPAAVAGYTAGSWPTYGPLVWAFPHAKHLSIAIGWGYRADCLDDEPGDATPSEVVPWVRAEIALGQPEPCVYSSVSQMFSDLNPRLAAAGLSNHVRRWCAWYRYFRGLISGCDAMQWSDHALSRNLDESTVALSFFGIAPKPVADRYRVLNRGFEHISGSLLSERRSVVAFDNAHCARSSAPVCGHYRREIRALKRYLVGVVSHSRRGWDERNRRERGYIMDRRS